MKVRKTSMKINVLFKFSLVATSIRIQQSNRRRTARSIICPDDPDGIGHVTVFIREACPENGQYPFRPIRFPFARFDHRRLRKLF